MTDRGGAQSTSPIPRKAKRASPELQLQASVRAQLRYKAPGVAMVAIPNGTYIATMAGRRRAAMEGLSAGFPDAIFLWDGSSGDGGYCFIEFKASKGVMSENQREWGERLLRWGHPFAVVRTPEAAFAFLRLCGADVRGEGV